VWKKRHLTPYGKITVIKSLAFSKIIHLFNVLPDPTEDFLVSLEKECFMFLWDGKPSKIKKSIVYKQYSKGGIRMVNIRSFLSAMKLSWLRRLQSDSYLKQFLVNMHPEIEKIVQFGGEYYNVTKQKVNNSFWCDVAKHFKRLSLKCIPNSEHNFLAECIFYNTNITRGGKVEFVKEWYNFGILYVHQLLNNEGFFGNFEEFLNKYPGIKTHFLLYNGIIASIKKYEHKLGVKIESGLSSDVNLTWAVIKKGNKHIQNILNANNDVPTCINKWNLEFENLDWHLIFMKCYLTTSDVQLRWFQARLLNRLIPTQRYLYLRKLIDSPTCNFCQHEEQTLAHLFYDCNVIFSFWNDFLNTLKEKCSHCHNLRFVKELIIFGMTRNTKTDSTFDFIILFAKFFIYKCKLQQVQPTLYDFLPVLYNRYKLELYIAAVNGTANKCKLNWKMYLSIFT
jgi:hypothetical protein